MTDSNVSRTRRLEGKVVRLSAEKTVSVLVMRRVKHKIGKYINRSKRFLVHDENAQATLGARVVIEEGRPISKRKSWNLVEVLETSES